MPLRFQVDKRGTVHNNIVDCDQPTANGAGIIASSHNDKWAKIIVDCLNYVNDRPNAKHMIIQIPKEAETDYDT